ncbi:zinc-dependent metalloprotease [Flagellimonas crocea]|uniref:zinc-dependent metalloprotease n=1 Tax=Flagellimonas crocea TaxID=3067311 RepID=UPI00296F840E|nr:M12 family metallo-peptidase [Muricauda sp. DH64]
MKKITLAFSLFMILSIAHAQNNFQLKKIPLDDKNIEKLNGLFTNYEVLDLDLVSFDRKISSSLIETEVSWAVEEGKQYNMKIHPKAILSNKVEMGIVTKDGFTPYKQSKIKTYSGYLDDNNYVRLTVDEDFIYGIIKNENSVTVIEQLKYLLEDKSISPDKIVLYELDNLKDLDGICTTDETLAVKNLDSEMDLSQNSYVPPCDVLEVAVDADATYFNKYGLNTYPRIQGIFNNFQDEYANTFNIQIVLVAQQINLTGAYSSTNSATIISEIQSVWTTGTRISIGRDLVHHFTAKNLGGNLGRASGIGDICDIRSCSYTKDRTDEFLTTAHEIGHNLGGLHGDAVSCNTTNASVMCQGQKRDPVYWSNASQNRINNFIDTQNCINNNIDDIYLQGPDQICIGETKTYSIQNLINQGVTTWSVPSYMTILSQNNNVVTVRKDGGGSTNMIIADVSYPGGCPPVSVSKLVLSFNCSQSQSTLLTVFPNPASQTLYIDFANSQIVNDLGTEKYSKTYMLHLYDIGGTLVQTNEWNDSKNTMKMDVSELKSGNYFLRITSKDLEETYQVLIE